MSMGTLKRTTTTTQETNFVFSLSHKSQPGYGHLPNSKTRFNLQYSIDMVNGYDDYAYSRCGWRTAELTTNFVNVRRSHDEGRRDARQPLRVNARELRYLAKQFLIIADELQGTKTEA